jgi:uncharacterized repeat protein (TIGR03847 family)
VDLERVEKLTTGAVGEPGRRTFFIQARARAGLVTVTVEKEQVELLGTSILEILATVGRDTGEGPPEEELELDAPLEPLWRAGRLSIGYSEDRDLMVLELEELVEEAEDAEAERPEPARVRIWATREQMFALARHGTTVTARGRPRCRFCGNPIDPAGHVCPAMNGHRQMAGR